MQIPEQKTQVGLEANTKPTKKNWILRLVGFGTGVLCYTLLNPIWEHASARTKVNKTVFDLIGFILLVLTGYVVMETIIKFFKPVPLKAEEANSLKQDKGNPAATDVKEHFLSTQNGVLSLAILITVVAALALNIIISMNDFNDESSAIGDTIGGIVTPVIGVLAAYLTYQAFRQQVVANTNQQNQISKEKERYEKSSFENNFFRLVDYLKDCEKNINLEALGSYQGTAIHNINILHRSLFDSLKNYSESINANTNDINIIAAGVLFFGNNNYFNILIENKKIDKSLGLLLKEFYNQNSKNIHIENSSLSLRSVSFGLSAIYLPILNILTVLYTYLEDHKKLIESRKMDFYKLIVYNSLQSDTVRLLYLFDWCHFDIERGSLSTYFKFNEVVDGEIEITESNFFRPSSNERLAFG